MEVKSNLKECAFCLVEATCLCYKCLEYYCDSCYNIAHKNEKRKNRLFSSNGYEMPRT